MSQVITSDWRVRRLDVNPIIRPGMHPRIGDNIQGPSLIRVPDWVCSPLGRYYLYFADHKGDHIRLAYADSLEGPWRIYAPGALSLDESLYPTDVLHAPANGQVLPVRPDWAPVGTPGIPTQLEDASIPHIASPDVIVDHGLRQIRMYFHGLAAFGRQQTRVAISTNGLHFKPRAPLLGPSYFRVFRYRDDHFALVMPGVLYRSADGLEGFERGPDLFGDPRQRHSAVWLDGDTLWVFWTRVADMPERIHVSRIALDGDWTSWRASPPEELLAPERDWEGGALPLERSWRSAVAQPVRQLRDPAVYEEGERLWLLYAVQGESGIAIAEIARRAST
jgi:hypothetical protein